MTPRSPGALRIVQITTGFPVVDVKHAGGVYQRDITRSLRHAGHEVVVLAPVNRTNRATVADSIADVSILPEDGPARWEPVGVLIRAAHRLNEWAHRSWIAASHPPFVVALALQPRVWRLLRTADVIDLQWFAQIRLQPLVRLLAGRRPAIVGTFHDVVSQRLERASAVAASDTDRREAAEASRRARRMESRLGRALDRSVVLSPKDRDLLEDAGVPAASVEVVAPMFAAAREDDDHVPRRRDVVLMVGYFSRHENVDAALWLLDEIWPRVRDGSPAAELRLVGAGAPPPLVDAAASSPGVVMLGFVDDLWRQYREAACTVVPLRDGAGVKFKTLEALLAGAPTVATPIGAEGVGVESDFVAVSDDPAVLAAGISATLADPRHALEAAEAARRLTAVHGRPAFDAAVAHAYGGRSGDADPPGGHPRETVSSTRR